MDHFEEIYASQAEDYHRMIAAEDVDGNLLRAIRHILPTEDAHLIDLGSGTGRIPIMLDPHVEKITCLDRSRAMLLENQRQGQEQHANWDLIQADLGQIPLKSQTASILTAGWALGHFCGWYPQDWKARMQTALQEMMRILMPGGWLVIFETLGTGTRRPKAPNPDLAAYYAWLESDWGFTCQVIATDYLFGNVDEAATSTAFFFGPELEERIRRYGWNRIPEWTGMWSLQSL